MTSSAIISSGSSGSSGSSYTFGIVKARSEERKQVRVTFNEEPLAVDPLNINDALHLDNWSVEVVEPTSEHLIAYAYVNILRVARVEGFDKEIDIFVDHDFSFDVQYKVSVNRRVQANISGFWNIDGPSDYDFDPYDPTCRNKPMPRIYDWWGGAVKGFDQSRDAERMAAIFQDVMEQVKSLIDCMADLFDPLRCPESFLDARLEGLGNPFGALSSGMTVVEKRRLALKLIEIYRKKGTIDGIKYVIEFLLNLSTIYVVPVVQSTGVLRDSVTAKTSGVTGDEYKIGHSVFDPSGDISGYPTSPIDSVYPENEQYTGNFRLGPGKPSYYWAALGAGAGVEEVTQVSKIGGQWHLGDASFPARPFEPSDDIDESAIIQEKNRRGHYQYRIVSTETLTDAQKQRIVDLATYMQPANAVLVEVRNPPTDDYDPLVLGLSKLGHDWKLHG